MIESLAYRMRGWASSELLEPLVEPILHPSRWRIRALGLTLFIGHPLFYAIWVAILLWKCGPALGLRQGEVLPSSIPRQLK